MEVFIYILVIIGLFIIGRKIVLWYYKIDESILLQKETNRLLRKIAGEKELETEPEESLAKENPDGKKTPEQELEDYNKRLYG